MDTIVCLLRIDSLAYHQLWLTRAALPRHRLKFVKVGWRHHGK
jgi:hypothetical protein